MKKAISVLLAVLMLFSALSVVCFAAEGEEEIGAHTIKYYDWDGTYLGSRIIEHNGTISPWDSPTPPHRDPDENYIYEFDGWATDLEGTTVYKSLSTLPLATQDTSYYAHYAKKENVETFTFLKFIASIFERINMIFEYFSTIFSRGM